MHSLCMYKRFMQVYIRCINVDITLLLRMHKQEDVCNGCIRSETA